MCQTRAGTWHGESLRPTELALRYESWPSRLRLEEKVRLPQQSPNQRNQSWPSSSRLVDRLSPECLQTEPIHVSVESGSTGRFGPGAGPTPPAGNAAVQRVSNLREENAQLQCAVHAHAIVHQAIGVILATSHLTSDQGWDALREISQQTNIKPGTLPNQSSTGADRKPKHRHPQRAGKRPLATYTGRRNSRGKRGPCSCGTTATRGRGPGPAGRLPGCEPTGWHLP
ncbi:ANTAR domain-containing protein [Streptomyces sp. NPDC095817]|uniref:ANTAR domain-containing protein n=1 Tax=Streptomyces sp. NPDC095817 TaxID=3155082 RepID=UPI0033264BD0